MSLLEGGTDEAKLKRVLFVCELSTTLTGKSDSPLGASSLIAGENEFASEAVWYV